MQALLQELDEAIAVAEVAKVSAKYGKKCRKKLMNALQALQSEFPAPADACLKDLPSDDTFNAPARNQDCGGQVRKASNSVMDPLTDSAQSMQCFNLHSAEHPPDDCLSPPLFRGKENNWGSFRGKHHTLLQVLLYLPNFEMTPLNEHLSSPLPLTLPGPPCRQLDEVHNLQGSNKEVFCRHMHGS